jgi:hypothetical protein
MRDDRSSRELDAGDWVIYRVTKHTTHPGPRAREVAPSPRGEFYSYAVEKQWLVSEVRDDGSLVVTTRRGKRRLVAPNDPALRRPSLWERFALRKRFPRGDAAPLAPKD